jgi:hypothetical protein
LACRVVRGGAEISSAYRSAFDDPIKANGRIGGVRPQDARSIKGRWQDPILAFSPVMHMVGIGISHTRFLACWEMRAAGLAANPPRPLW